MSYIQELCLWPWISFVSSSILQDSAFPSESFVALLLLFLDTKPSFLVFTPASGELHSSLPGRLCPPVCSLNPRAPEILVFISFFFFFLQLKLSLSGLASTPIVKPNIFTALTLVFSLLPSESSVRIQREQFKLNMHNWTPTSGLLTTCSFPLYNWYHYEVSSLKQIPKI